MGGGTMEHMAAANVTKADPTDKVFVAAIIVFVLLLSALTAGIPDPTPYDQTVNNGDK
jgi:hypothetical protein